MKICICTSSPDLDSQVSPVFGRAPHFLIFDLEKKELKTLSNPAFQAFRGAGVAASQMLVSEKVKAVIAGNFGPNAFAFLQMSKVRVYPVLGLTAKEALEKYEKGELKEMKTPTMGPGFGFPGQKRRYRRRGR